MLDPLSRALLMRLLPADRKGFSEPRTASMSRRKTCIEAKQERRPAGKKEVGLVRYSFMEIDLKGG